MYDICRDIFPCISPDQTGFVNGRYIGCNVHRILNLQNLCKERDINGLLLSLDFQKDVDMLDWDILCIGIFWIPLIGFPLHVLALSARASVPIMGTAI